MKLFLYSFALVFTSNLLLAQGIAKNSTTPEIKIIYKILDSGIKLRWAPKSKEQWWYLKNKGFDIYRARYDDALPSGKDYKLIKSNVSLLPQQDFEETIDDPDVNDYFKIIGMASYGEWESVKPGSSPMGNWGHRVEELESRYLAVMYSCDMNFAAAEAAGLAYYDTEAPKGKNVVYKIVITQDTIYRPLFKVVLQADQKKQLTPNIARGIEKENQVVLQWSRAVNERLFTAYYIEKSKDGKSFKRINDKPYINPESETMNNLLMISYIDSVENYDPHYYRIIGIDAFGDESKPSIPLRLMGRDRTPPLLPTIDSIYLQENQKAITLRWHFEDKSDDLEKIYIKKGPKISGPFIPIGETSHVAIKYEDKNPIMSSVQYYQICVADTAKNMACTPGRNVIFNDRIAPQPPSGLVGSIDSNGVVFLSWNMGKEKDILGYFVHKSNGKGRVFTNMTNKPIRDTVWRDTITLHTLTEDVYYRVNVVDLRKNYSQFSNIIRLVKPDTIPPRPSIFKHYKVNKDNISLDYAISSSSDVTKVILVRTTVGSNKKKEVSLKRNSKSYKDFDISPNTTYKYNLITFDDAGHQTAAPQLLNLKSLDNKTFHKVKLTYTIDKNDLILNWDEPLGEVDFIKIYRGKTIKKMLTYKTVKEIDQFKTSSKTFYDQFVKIKIFYKNGVKSPFSNTVQIKSK